MDRTYTKATVFCSDSAVHLAELMLRVAGAKTDSALAQYIGKKKKDLYRSMILEYIHSRIIRDS